MIILPVPSLLGRLCQGFSGRNDPDQFHFMPSDALRPVDNVAVPEISIENRVQTLALAKVQRTDIMKPGNVVVGFRCRGGASCRWRRGISGRGWSLPRGWNAHGASAEPCAT
jgi:hypothetical protein